MYRIKGNCPKSVEDGIKRDAMPNEDELKELEGMSSTLIKVSDAIRDISKPLFIRESADINLIIERVIKELGSDFIVDDNIYKILKDFMVNVSDDTNRTSKRVNEILDECVTGVLCDKLFLPYLHLICKTHNIEGFRRECVEEVLNYMFSTDVPISLQDKTIIFNVIRYAQAIDLTGKELKDDVRSKAIEEYDNVYSNRTSNSKDAVNKGYDEREMWNKDNKNMSLSLYIKNKLVDTDLFTVWETVAKTLKEYLGDDIAMSAELQSIIDNYLSKLSDTNFSKDDLSDVLSKLNFTCIGDKFLKPYVVEQCRAKNMNSRIVSVLYDSLKEVIPNNVLLNTDIRYVIDSVIECRNNSNGYFENRLQWAKENGVTEHIVTKVDFDILLKFAKSQLPTSMKPDDLSDDEVIKIVKGML